MYVFLIVAFLLGQNKLLEIFVRLYIYNSPLNVCVFEMQRKQQEHHNRLLPHKKEEK